MRAAQFFGKCKVPLITEHASRFQVGKHFSATSRILELVQKFVAKRQQ